MSNDEKLPAADVYNAVAEATDKALAELASMPMEARYRADLERYGSEENALRAASIRARDAKLMIDAAKAAMKDC